MFTLGLGLLRPLLLSEPYVFDLIGYYTISSAISDFPLTGPYVLFMSSSSPSFGYKLLDYRCTTDKAFKSSYFSFSSSACLISSYFYAYTSVLWSSFYLRLAYGCSFSIVTSLCSSTSGTWERGFGIPDVFVFTLVCMDDSRSLSLRESSMLTEAF